MRIVDLSVALRGGIVSDPPYMLPTIEYLDHREGAKQFAATFPGLKPEQLPDGEGCAVERVDHLHTQRHASRRALALRQHHGRRQAGAEDRPGPAGMVLLRRRQARLPWQAGRLCLQGRRHQAELDRIGHALKPLDIVLVNTAAAAAYGQPNFLDKGCGMGREATLYMLKQGVRVTGTDGWSWDAPFSLHAPALRRNGRP